MQINNNILILKGSKKSFFVTFSFFLLSVSLFFWIPEIKSNISPLFENFIFFINSIVFNSEEELIAFYQSQPLIVGVLKYIEFLLWFIFIFLFFISFTSITTDFKSMFTSFIFDFKNNNVSVSFISFPYFSFQKISNNSNLINMEISVDVLEKIYGTCDLSLTFSGIGESFVKGRKANLKETEQLTNSFLSNETSIQEFHVWKINDVIKSDLTAELENIIKQEFLKPASKNSSLL